MEQKKEVLWHGRFSEGPDAQAVAFETSIHADMRLAQDDIRGSIAHAGMLGRQGIIPATEAADIARALQQIALELENGSLTVDTGAEDIHSFVEGVLTERLGDSGRKVHAGRSRNDQIALDERLYLKRALPDMQRRILELISVLVSIAERHTDTLMPGYTHLQRAQPVTLSHHLCAWCHMLARDFDRLSDALKRIDLSPLGSGALAGSSLPLDREYVASQLGFSGITENSLDSVSDRDYCIETASVLALIMTHLSRFCEEVVLWSTEEFKFISLSEKWSTGSSIMPQKKNPDFAELIRGKTGRVYGSLVALLTLMKGLPLSYNRDLQEDRENLFNAYDTVFSCLYVFTRMIETADWNTERMKDACYGGYANATDLADYLVKKGVPFRTAHAAAAQAVRRAIEKNVQLEELSLEELREFSPVIENDIFAKLSPEACVAARQTAGAPGVGQELQQISRLKDFLKRLTL